jgi:Holliday junction DNA helicase RuvB
MNLIKKALNSYQIDEKGLDSLDRNYLSFLNQNNNIPTGLDSIAAGLGDDSSMLEFVVEPYLIKIGFLTRTPRGRLLTALGKKYIDSKNDNF